MRLMHTSNLWVAHWYHTHVPSTDTRKDLFSYHHRVMCLSALMSFNYSASVRMLSGQPDALMRPLSCITSTWSWEAAEAAECSSDWNTDGRLQSLGAAVWKQQTLLILPFSYLFSHCKSVWRFILCESKGLKLNKLHKEHCRVWCCVNKRSSVFFSVVQTN